MLPTQCICSSVTASTDWLCIADGICYCVVATGCVGVTLLRCTINHTLQYRCIFILFSYCFVGQCLSAGISLYSLFFTMIHIYLIPEELYKHTHTHTHTVLEPLCLQQYNSSVLHDLITVRILYSLQTKQYYFVWCNGVIYYQILWHLKLIQIWFGCAEFVEHIGGRRNACSVLVWKSEGKTPTWKF